MEEIRQTEELLRRSDLNYRQLAVLGYALRDCDADLTCQPHARSHRVARQSARSDLLGLETKGFLKSTKMGRAIHFRPVADLADRVSRSPETADR